MSRSPKAVGLDGREIEKPRRLLTMREAAEELDRMGLIDSDRPKAIESLRRLLRHREVSLGTRLLLKVGEGKGARMLISMENLHLAFPQLASGSRDSRLEIVLGEVRALAQAVSEMCEEARANREDIAGILENLRTIRLGSR
jgi:hypothetical protein